MKSPNMNNFDLIIGNKKIPEDTATVSIDPNADYEVYGETKSGKQLKNLSLSHLSWLDSQMLKRDIELSSMVSVLYHPDVIADLLINLNGSPYWGKDRYEALEIYKRGNVSKESDTQRIKRKLAKGFNPKTERTRKSRSVDAVVNLGYSREHARQVTDDFLNEFGKPYLNLSPKELAELIDQHATRHINL